MAVYLSNTVQVTLNSVALTDHVTSATINRVFDELEVTAMGDTAHKFVKGLEASTITLDFLSDTAAANVNATLQAAWGTTVPITLKQTSAATSATNPLYSTTILVNNTTDINGAVADIATQSITFTCNSPIVITTAP
jgi:predicted secreted protein